MCTWHWTDWLAVAWKPFRNSVLTMLRMKLLALDFTMSDPGWWSQSVLGFHSSLCNCRNTSIMLNLSHILEKVLLTWMFYSLIMTYLMNLIIHSILLWLHVETKSFTSKKKWNCGACMTRKNWQSISQYQFYFLPL